VQEVCRFQCNFETQGRTFGFTLSGYGGMSFSCSAQVPHEYQSINYMHRKQEKRRDLRKTVGIGHWL